MRYQVQWHEAALRELRTLPPAISVKLVKKVDSYLAQDPRRLGKAMTGQFAGYYRYRFGDYRVVYGILEKEIRIYVVRIGHRKEVYAD